MSKLALSETHGGGGAGLPAVPVIDVRRGGRASHSGLDTRKNG